MTVETSSASLTPSPEYYGFIRIEASEDYRPMDCMRSDPWLDQSYSAYFLASRATYESIASRAGLTADPSRGILSVQVYDCTGAGAVGVSLEFWARAKSGFVQSENCEVTYPGESGYPDVSQTEFHFPGTSVALGTALGAVAIVARDTETGQPIGFLRSGYFEADRWAVVGIMPASRREVASMPAAFR